MGSKIWRIVGAAFVCMLGFGAVIPMLPVYLHEQAGASSFITGLLVGLSSAFALLGRLLGGKTADRKGRRIALLLGMGFCATAGVSACLPSLSLSTTLGSLHFLFHSIKHIG
jgi:MFS family permease